jgi:hypothetical protein
MIQQNSYIMAFMYILTHIAKIYLIFEAELRGIRPNEIKHKNNILSYLLSNFLLNYYQVSWHCVFESSTK